MTEKEKLDIVFPVEDEEEEIDIDSTDFDEENFESWDNDCHFTMDELRDWRTA